jgi:SAM-dependent methyltransferase
LESIELTLASPVAVVCPACHGTHQSGVLERHEQWSLYQCADCGVQHFWPAKNPGADWYQSNEMYAARDLMVVDWLGWYHRAALDNMPVKSGSVLDVGCGNGAFVAAATARGYEAWGIDFSEKAIEAGRKHFGLKRLYHASTQELAERFGTQRFDVVTAFEVLEHMDDARSFVRELVALTAPGGYVIVSVPNRERRPRLLNEGDLPPHHFTRWNADAVRRFLNDNGLSTEKIVICPTRITLKTFFHYTLHFSIVRRIVKRAQAPTVDSETLERTLAQAKSLTLLKERLLDAMSTVLAPPLGPFVRGPMLVAIARRAPADSET